jgi:hypothetical protein
VSARSSDARMPAVDTFLPVKLEVGRVRHHDDLVIDA